VEGIREAAEVVVVALMPDREPHVFGRRTMPDMDLASVSCAIQNMWLLSRAEVGACVRCLPGVCACVRACVRAYVP
jgi:nitroreductase